MSLFATFEPIGHAKQISQTLGTFQPFSPLHTDFYQLTMACGYWKTGKAQEEAVFHLFFRELPFLGGYAVACGLDQVIGYVNAYRFSEEDLHFLRGQKAVGGESLFPEAFLHELSSLRLKLTVDAIPEGTLIFPYEPLVRVQGSLLACQLLETALLNIINYQTLVATKSSRMWLASRGAPIYEFGLRRAHSFEAGLWASRAAYVGGTSGTSNTAAAQHWNIPARGTHAHSWVMSFDDEEEAFLSYATAFPMSCVLLVDTYNTLQGIEKAIAVGKALRARGGKLLALRIDSGDLAYFGQQARRRLDKAGFNQTQVMASGDLDEHIMQSLLEQESHIFMWGVGTRLVTGHPQGSLGAVYKMSCLKKEGVWTDKMKISDSLSKVNIPGIQQVRRFAKDGTFVADMIYDVRHETAKERHTLIHPTDDTRQKRIGTREHAYEDLLQPIFRAGECVYDTPSLQDIRAHHLAQLNNLDKSIKRLTFPHLYPVGLEKSLYERRKQYILSKKYAKNKKN